jgi:uncharacterized protein with FMN-binding domain
MARAAVAVVVTAAAVVALASYRTHPPRSAPAARPARHAAPAPPRLPPGTRAATGIAISTPYTTIQVRAWVRRGRVVAVREVLVANDNAHTQAINARAIPILHREALRARSARIDVVSGATGTSTSYAGSLQSAIDRARIGIP